MVVVVRGILYMDANTVLARRAQMWGVGAMSDPRNAELGAWYDQQIAAAHGIVDQYLATKAAMHADCAARADGAIAMQANSVFDWR